MQFHISIQVPIHMVWCAWKWHIYWLKLYVLSTLLIYLPILLRGERQSRSGTVGAQRSIGVNGGGRLVAHPRRVARGAHGRLCRSRLGVFGGHTWASLAAAPRWACVVCSCSQRRVKGRRGKVPRGSGHTLWVKLKKRTKMGSPYAKIGSYIYRQNTPQLYPIPPHVPDYII
jgi:hypothetical protein